jgi:hypothetical protein
MQSTIYLIQIPKLRLSPTMAVQPTRTPLKLIALRDAMVCRKTALRKIKLAPSVYVHATPALLIAVALDLEISP